MSRAWVMSICVKWKNHLVAMSKSRSKSVTAAFVVLTSTVNEQDLLSVVNEETNGMGVDVAFECSGAAASIRSCFEALKRLGSYTQVGISGGEITLNFDTILYKQLHVVGSVAYSVATWDRLLKILNQRAIRLNDLITHTLPLERWKEAFDLCERKKALKVLISPGASRSTLTLGDSVKTPELV
jgi:L-iditol 2-dehydrogenase